MFIDIYKIIGRQHKLFSHDISENNCYMTSIIKKSSFLVIGGAGSIGRATVKEIFRRNPKLLHVIDINENNLAELVRDLRSTYGYISGEFKTFAIDIGSRIYEKFIKDFGKYDYILNFSALKHVRSEKDIYTLMRIIEVNILNTIKTIEQSIRGKAKKYFCVSTDKATNPVNMMGASKRIMELFLIKYATSICISTARFANVAFSDGSLLYSFIQRIQKKQPIVAPLDVKRYFITPQEAGELCLLSTILGETKEIFFPKLTEKLALTKFSDIAKRFINSLGYEPHICQTEEEARTLAPLMPEQRKWACYFTVSDTTGEKNFEEFYTVDERVDYSRFSDVGIIKSGLPLKEDKLKKFLQEIEKLYTTGWSKQDIIDLFNYILPNFNHKETGKYLDEKM